MTEPTADLLLIEDDMHLARGLAYNLEKAGYRVEVETDGARGLEAALAKPFDLIVLDLMLPGRDGYEVLETLRSRGRTVPVIILSARDAEVDKIRGFDTGADDYVTKPFGVGELLARIRARLHKEAPACEKLALGDGVVDLERLTFERCGHVEPLTPTEVEILRVLGARPGVPVDREVLMKAIWGVERTTSRTLDAHVTRLRRKIEPDPHQPRHLLTVHGVGYRLLPTPP